MTYIELLKSVVDSKVMTPTEKYLELCKTVNLIDTEMQKKKTKKESDINEV